VKTDSDSKLEQIQNNRDFISSVLDEIFLICRSDSAFHEVKTQIEGVDDKLETFNKRLRKQTNLLEQSNQIEQDVKQKIAILNDQTFKMRAELLEQLGSSI